MCIRDRSIAMKVLDEETVPLMRSEKVRIITEAVSYTHLDVYKRQGLFRSEKFERGESELIILITPRIVQIGETMFWDRIVRDDALEAFEIDVKTLGK